MIHHAGEVTCAVLACFVGPKVDAHGCRRAGGVQPRSNCLHPVVVKTKAVDGGAILGQPEEAWLGIARLWQRGGGAHFDKAETGL